MSAGRYRKKYISHYWPFYIKTDKDDAIVVKCLQELFKSSAFLLILSFVLSFGVCCLSYGPVVDCF